MGRANRECQMAERSGFVQGRAEVGPTSRWATQEGHVDPVHGQRRKVAKSKKKKKQVKEKGRGGEGIQF